MSEAILVYTTWPDAETAGAAAAAAVEARLAACVNMMAPIASVYRWEGEIEHAVETPVIFKTTPESVERLKAFILARHPYEVPCVLALPVQPAGSNVAYVGWIAAETGEN
jgi:periplasmic divalent cation tolerance protein